MATRSRKRRKKKPPMTQWDWYLRVLLGLAVVVLVAFGWFLMKQRADERRLPSDFGERLFALAEARGAGPADVSADDPIRKVDGVFVRFWRIAVPNRTALGALREDILTELQRWDVRVTEPKPATGDTARLRLDFETEAFAVDLVVARQRQAALRRPTPTRRPPATATPRPQPPPNARGRLAILLDDAGQSRELLDAATALPKPVAVSVLPFLPHSSHVAVEFHRAGHEVWLHLPMEPVGYPKNDPGPGALLVSMTESEIRTAVHTAVNNVPHLVGMNNHMGSKATADLRVMTWVMQELKGRGLFFIDSRTTRDTVAEDAARAQGVRANRRRVFLDNERTRVAIRRQLDEAIYRARLEGEAIAIGHVAKTTIQVLAEEIPRLRRRGADLVAPSRLVR
jgi:polysaccharide deacetylase 2 family uncharacterized protein YibQ